MTTFAGLPATMAFAGTSLVTTALAATIELSPIVTPLHIRAKDPTHTLLPITMGARITSYNVCYTKLLRLFD